MHHLWRGHLRCGSSSREARKGELLPTHSAEKRGMDGHGAFWEGMKRGAPCAIFDLHLYKTGASGMGPRFLILYLQGACTMHHLYTPFVVVPLIVVVFLASILWATSSKEDGHSSH